MNGNGWKGLISSIKISKKEYGLPENSIILGCFNNNYKITEEIFNLSSRSNPSISIKEPIIIISSIENF